MTQEDVAEAVPCGAVALGRWEKRISKPSLVKAIGYGRAVGCYLGVSRDGRRIRAASSSGINWDAREAKELCLLLGDLRDDTILTQQQLADKVGVTQGGYGRIERGEKHPSLPLLIAALGVFDARVEWVNAAMTPEEGRAEALRWMADLRAARTMSLDELGEIVGESRSTLSRQLLLQDLPTLLKIVRLGRAMGLRAAIFDAEGRDRRVEIEGSTWEDGEVCALIEAVRALRRQRGLNQTSFAVEVGVSPGTLFHIEQLQNYPGAAILARYLAALDASFVWVPLEETKVVLPGEQ